MTDLRVGEHRGIPLRTHPAGLEIRRNAVPPTPPSSLSVVDICEAGENSKEMLILQRDGTVRVWQAAFEDLETEYDVWAAGSGPVGHLELTVTQLPSTVAVGDKMVDGDNTGAATWAGDESDAEEAVATPDEDGALGAAFNTLDLSPPVPAAAFSGSLFCV